MSTPTIHIPSNEREALQWLIPTLDQSAEQISSEAFKRAWAAVFYLYGGLHPDDAIEHGTEQHTLYDGPEEYRDIDSRLIVPRYTKSGWPVALAPLADDAWRRYELEQLQDDEMYCSEAQHAGFMARMNA